MKDEAMSRSTEPEPMTQMTRSRLAEELFGLIERAGEDELRVLLFMARRFIGFGQDSYGKLDIATDRRDGVTEATEEAADGLFYLSYAFLKQSLSPDMRLRKTRMLTARRRAWKRLAKLYRKRAQRAQMMYEHAAAGRAHYTNLVARWRALSARNNSKLIGELIHASIEWALQGPRSRWSTAPSLRLYDVVSQLTEATNDARSTVSQLGRGQFEPKPGDYAELVDESEPDGAVRICRQDGTPVAVMSRRAFNGFYEQRYLRRR